MKRLALYVKNVFLLFLKLLVLVPLAIVVLPVFYRIANLFETKGFRVRNKRFQTSVTTYLNPKTDRTVVFIATIHEAESRYFSNIQMILNDLSSIGYRVIYEGLKPMKSKQKKRLTDKERCIESSLFAHGFSDECRSVLPIVRQNDSLECQKDWINADMNVRDLVKNLASKNVHFGKKCARDTGENYVSVMKYDANNCFKKALGANAISRISNIINKNSRLYNEVILDCRNKIAMEEIERNLAHSNVVTIWGEAHLRGIEKGLSKLGFVELKKEWLTAYHILDYGFFKMLRDFKQEFFVKISENFLMPGIISEMERAGRLDKKSIRNQLSGLSKRWKNK